MLRLPNFFLLIFIKPAAWRIPLVLVVPLFLVDELLEICETLYYVFGRRKVPRQWRESADKAVTGIRRVWRSTRRAGAFTLVDIKAEGVRISVRLV